MNQLELMGFEGAALNGAVGLTLPIFWSRQEESCVVFRRGEERQSLTRPEFDRLAKEGYVTPLAPNARAIQVPVDQAASLRIVYVSDDFKRRTKIELSLELAGSARGFWIGPYFEGACVSKDIGLAFLRGSAVGLVERGRAALRSAWSEPAATNDARQLAADARVCAATGSHDDLLFEAYAVGVAAEHLAAGEVDYWVEVSQSSLQPEHRARLERYAQELLVEELGPALSAIKKTGAMSHPALLERISKLEPQLLKMDRIAPAIFLEYCCHDSKSLRMAAHKVAVEIAQLPQSLMYWVTEFRLGEALGFAAKMLGEARWAEEPRDVLDDFLVRRATRSWQTFSPDHAPLSVYLLYGERGALRTFIGETKRSAGKRAARTTALAAAADGAVVGDPLLRAALEIAVAQLPRGEREVVELIWRDDLKPAEAATRLGIAPGTARVRWLRARQRMVKILQDLGVELSVETTGEERDAQ